MILHLADDEADVYFVEDNGFVYTYQPHGAAAAQAASEIAATSVAGPALNLLRDL